MRHYPVTMNAANAKALPPPLPFSHGLHGPRPVGLIQRERTRRWKRLSAGSSIIGVIFAAVFMAVGLNAASAATASTAHHAVAGRSARPGPALQPVQIANCDGRLEQFTVGSGHHLYHRWQTTRGGSWSNWASLGGYLISNVAVVRNVNCHIEVFGVAPGNAMWHIWQTNPGSGPWSKWASLGGFLTSGPAVGFIAGSGGRAYVLAIGGDSRYWCDAQSRPASGPWTGWYRC